jgi:hypothetical protein
VLKPREVLLHAPKYTPGLESDRDACQLTLSDSRHGYPALICRCARHTEEECIQGGLFGLPESLAQAERGAIQALAPGLPVFLFNFQTRVPG